MEITLEKYQELQNKVEQLQREVDMLSIPSDNFINKRSIRQYITECPITDVRFDDIESFRYTRGSTGVWELFKGIAKELVQEPSKHVERSTRDYSRKSKYNYMELKLNINKTKHLSNFTDEEFKTSVDMLNEMSVIYNKYYKKLHPTALVNFKEMESGDFKNVEVVDN